MNWPRNLSPARARVFDFVGKAYHFECPQCHYRAKVSGGVDSGIHCEVQTLVCRDCRELMDVFTKVQRREGATEKIVPWPQNIRWKPGKIWDAARVAEISWRKTDFQPKFGIK